MWCEGSSYSEDSPLVLPASHTAFTLGWLKQTQRLPESERLGQSMVHGAEQHTVPVMDVLWWVKHLLPCGCLRKDGARTWAAFPQTFLLHGCARWAGVGTREQEPLRNRAGEGSCLQDCSLQGKV